MSTIQSPVDCYSSGRPFSRRMFLQDLLLLFGATGCAGTSALVPKTPVTQPETDGERICVSLRVLEKMARRSQQAGEAVPHEVAVLGGLSFVEGYICHPAGQDVVLMGRTSRRSTRAELHLDDLVVNLRNVRERFPAPYCSLDPRNQDVLALNRLFHQAGRLTDIDRIRAIFREMKEIWGPQKVVVGGVPEQSRHAHTMIMADYELKKASQSLLTLPGITSHLDRLLIEAEECIRQGRMPAMKCSMARFWFHLAENHPNFLVDDGIVRLRDCSVIVLTQPQRAAIDGTLSDSGEQDTLAASFAQQVSDAFPQLVAQVPAFAALESLYRLSAVLRVMDLQSAPQMAGLNLEYLLNEYRLIAPKLMPPDMPGLVNGKEKEINIRRGDMVGTLFLHPMVCGGVGMDMRVTAEQLHRDTTMMLPHLKLAAINQRPDRETLWWRIS